MSWRKHVNLDVYDLHMDPTIVIHQRVCNTINISPVEEPHLTVLDDIRVSVMASSTFINSHMSSVP